MFHKKWKVFLIVSALSFCLAAPQTITVCATEGQAQTTESTDGSDEEAIKASEEAAKAESEAAAKAESEAAAKAESEAAAKIRRCFR